MPYAFQEVNMMCIETLNDLYYKNPNIYNRMNSTCFIFRKPTKNDTIILLDEAGINIKCKMHPHKKKLELKFEDNYLDLDTTKNFELIRTKGEY